MKHIILKAAVFTGLLAFGTSVYAQNDPYYQTNRDEGWWRGHLFERVRADLDHIQQVTPKISGDEYRLVVTKKDLNDLQSKMESNHYDQPALERTIMAVEKVANDNNLSPRDRTMLQDDLRRLREFREHHDGYR